MKYFFALFLAVLTSGAVVEDHQYDTFSDYLKVIEDKSRASSSEEGSGEATVATRSHYSCCDLGNLAGEKHFPCNPHHYVLSLLRENTGVSLDNFLKINATTGKKSYKLMMQLDKCVSGQSRHLQREFRKCCDSAYLYKEKIHFQQRQEEEQKKYKEQKKQEKDAEKKSHHGHGHNSRTARAIRRNPWLS